MKRGTLSVTARTLLLCLFPAWERRLCGHAMSCAVKHLHKILQSQAEHSCWLRNNRIPDNLRNIFRAYHRDAPSVKPFVYSWTLLLYLLNAVWDAHTTKQEKLVQQDHWEHLGAHQISLVSCNFQSSDVVCGRAGVQVGRQRYPSVEITSAFLASSHMHLYDANAELVNSLRKISS